MTPMTQQDAEKLARAILEMVAHVQTDHSGSHWWGDDTECGGESELIAEAVERMRGAGVVIESHSGVTE